MNATIKFETGQLMATPNAKTQVNNQDMHAALARHMAGDWGNVSDADKKLNDYCVTAGYRLLSIYTDRHGKVFWITTEADRSATTVWLPSDHPQSQQLSKVG